MKTFVKEWQIVSVVEDSENSEVIGEVLFGICIEDNTNRFQNGDYICTSRIISIHGPVIETVSGSIYQMAGEGVRSQISIKDFQLLRSGYSPEQIDLLNKVKAHLQH